MFFWKFPLYVVEDLKNHSLILKNYDQHSIKQDKKSIIIKATMTMHSWFLRRSSNNARLVVQYCKPVRFKLPPLVTFTLVKIFCPILTVHDLNYLTSIFLFLISNFHQITLSESGLVRNGEQLHTSASSCA